MDVENVFTFKEKYFFNNLTNRTHNSILRNFFPFLQQTGVSNPSIVTDGMMTSSSDDSRWSVPKFGRLGTKSDDKSVGAWCAAYQDKNQFLQIQIEEGTMVGGE